MILGSSGINGILMGKNKLKKFRTHMSKIADALVGIRASLVAQLVKNSPAMQETLIRFLGREDSLEKIPSILGLPW